MSNDDTKCPKCNQWIDAKQAFIEKLGIIEKNEFDLFKGKEVNWQYYINTLNTIIAIAKKEL
jgi:hypothetical protein